jgi:hypothetical protein
VLWGPSVSAIVRQGFARKRVATGGGAEPNPLSSQGIQVLQFLGGPRAPATTGLPRFQEAPAAMADDGLWRWMSQQKPHRGGLRQSVEQRMQLRKREVQSGSPWGAPWAAPLLQGHGPPQQAVGGRECRSTGNGQQELALAQSVEDTRGLFFIRLTGAVLPRFAMVAHRLTGHAADLRATACEPFVEGLPRNTGRFHGDQATLTPVCVQVGRERLFKAPKALTGMGKFELTTTHGGLRPQTSTGLGLAHIDSHEEQVRVVSIRFTLMRVSCLLLQAHGARLLVG